MLQYTVIANVLTAVGISEHGHPIGTTRNKDDVAAGQSLIATLWASMSVLGAWRFSILQHVRWSETFAEGLKRPLITARVCHAQCLLTS